MEIILSIFALFLIRKGLEIIKSSNPRLDSFSVDFKEIYENDKSNEVILFHPEKTNQKKTKPKKTFIDKDGYRRFIDSGILIHRWMMEKETGQKLKPGEVVHHIDGNKRNNDIKNLMLFDNQDDHNEYHQKNLRETGCWHGLGLNYFKYNRY